MFTTDRLTIRAYEPSDHSFLVKLMNDPKIQCSTDPLPIRPAPSAKVDHVLKLLADAYFFGIVAVKPLPGSLEPSQPIGYTFLRGGEDVVKNRNVMFALAFETDAHGKGYGTEVTRFMVDWAFRMGGLHRVWLGVYEDNDCARRVYEKAGFVQEGVVRKVNWRDGRWLDSVLMSILYEDWTEDASYQALAARRDASELI